MDALPRLKDDGLPAPDVGAWAENKYDRLRYYADLFSRSMKEKWTRSYLDLFSGSGRARIEGTLGIIPGSPTIALTLSKPFDKYLFCEANVDLAAALEIRIRRDFPALDASVLCRDVNESVEEILRRLPKLEPGAKSLTLCVADPCKIRDLRFETVKRLSIRYMDFIVLVPSKMDANRNIGHYLSPDNSILDNFLGSTRWRDEWTKYERKEDAGGFVADQFGKQMASLGYIYGGMDSAAWLNRSTGKNLPLYHLMGFSRHPLGAELWKESLQYANPQIDLFRN